MNDLTQEDLWRLRGMVQKSGWKNLCTHIGSIMAEQADKVKPNSEQDKALANLSMFFHNPSVQEELVKCGTFDYSKYIVNGWIDDEYKKFVE